MISAESCSVKVSGNELRPVSDSVGTSSSWSRLAGDKSGPTWTAEQLVGVSFLLRRCVDESTKGLCKGEPESGVNT